MLSQRRPLDLQAEMWWRLLEIHIQSSWLKFWLEIEVLARDISPGLVILFRVFIALRLKAVTKVASIVKIRGSVLPWQASG